MNASVRSESGQVAADAPRGDRRAAHPRAAHVHRRIPSWMLWVITIAAPLAIFVAWWLASAESIDPYFPPLAVIIESFRELWLFANFASDVVPSLANLVVSYALAVILGIGAGTLLGLNRIVAGLFDPIIHFWRAIPPVALVPIIVAVIGFGNETRILSITIAAVFPTLIATIDGLRSIEPIQKDMARVYQLSPSERVFHVYLPGAGPRIASGMQVSLQTAFVVMIASEMLGSATGIGAKTLLAQQSFAIPDMWAGILLLGVIGFVANAIFELLERRVLAWYIGAQAQGRSS
ncbi:MAG: ABC transporter permease [Pseudoclavibacter sp.]